MLPQPMIPIPTLSNDASLVRNSCESLTAMRRSLQGVAAAQGPLDKSGVTTASAGFLQRQSTASSKAYRIRAGHGAWAQQNKVKH